MPDHVRELRERVVRHPHGGIRLEQQEFAVRKQRVVYAKKVEPDPAFDLFEDRTILLCQPLLALSGRGGAGLFCPRSNSRKPLDLSRRLSCPKAGPPVLAPGNMVSVPVVQQGWRDAEK